MIIHLIIQNNIRNILFDMMIISNNLRFKRKNILKLLTCKDYSYPIYVSPGLINVSPNIFFTDLKSIKSIYFKHMFDLKIYHDYYSK